MSTMDDIAHLSRNALEYLLSELPNANSPPQDALDLFAINLTTGEVAYQTPKFDSQLMIRDYKCDHMETIVRHVDRIQRNPAKYQTIADGIDSGSAKEPPLDELTWLTQSERVDVSEKRAILGYFADTIDRSRESGELANVLSPNDYRSALSIVLAMRYDTFVGSSTD